MTVYRLVHSGELPAIRVGRSFRIPEQAVYDYLRYAEEVAVADTATTSNRYATVGDLQPASKEKVVRAATEYDFLPEGAATQTDRIPVHIFLDTEDRNVIRKIVAGVDGLVDSLGYDGPIGTMIERGSFIRRSWARLKPTLTSPEAQKRFNELERAAQLRIIDNEQADVNLKMADAFGKLMEAINEVDNATVRVGSMLVVKYEGNVFCRQLSQQDVLALERVPEIQNNPRRVLESLGMALDNLRAEFD